MTTETDNDGLDAILAKFADTPERAVQFELVGREVVRAAALYADPKTQADAEALFKGWSEMKGDSLRKAIASHFLERARRVVQTGSMTGAGGPMTAKAGVHPMIARLRARVSKPGKQPTAGGGAAA